MPKKSRGWERIYKFVKKIPRGRVTTYGRIAHTLRIPGGARTVGFAMAACPSGEGIPWHRVVGEKGKLLPREPYASKQRRLLESEGVAFDGFAVALAMHLWSPNEHARRKKPLRGKRQGRRR